MSIGQELTLTATGFAPGSDVLFEIHSDAVKLGTVKADATGQAQLTWKVAGVAPGVHHAVAFGKSASGDPLVLKATFTVTSDQPQPPKVAPPSRPGLPRTGA